ncbi:transgelin [Diutina catenulata]
MSFNYSGRYASPNKDTQSAPTNLDQDVNKSRKGRYQDKQGEVKEYLVSVLGSSLFDQKFSDPELRQTDLMEALKDGEVLCRLGQKVTHSPNPTTKFRNSKMPFVQMENTSFFLSLCEAIGVPHDEIFVTVDMFESKDPYQVILTLMSFSRVAHQMDPETFPTLIGPKVVKMKPQVPVKPKKLQS